MVRCPHCQTEIDHIETELLNIEPTEEIRSTPDGGKAVASVCPECNVLLGL